MFDKLMKKSVSCFLAISIASVILPTIAAASPHAPFCGFNIGVGGGMTVPVIPATGLLEIDIPGVQHTDFHVFRRTTNTGFQGNVRLGYNTLFQSCLVGLAADCNFGSNRMRFDADVTEADSEYNLPLNSSVQLKNQYALLFKFGNVIGKNTLLYGLVGPQWGDFTFVFDADYSQDLGNILEGEISTHDRLYKSGILLGLGSEMMLTPCISLSLEYAHTFYGSLMIERESGQIFVDGVQFPGAEVSLTNEFNSRVHSIMLRLTYYF